eukprot:117016-Prymnesium_polylepis.1
MIASYGHGPPHDLILVGVACASALLPCAVGVTVTAPLYDSTHDHSAIPQRKQRNTSTERDKTTNGAIGTY